MMEPRGVSFSSPEPKRKSGRQHEQSFTSQTSDFRDSGDGDDGEYKELAPHEAVLHDYFGYEAANDILHPKIEMGVKSGNAARVTLGSRETTRASLLSQRSDVETLWKNLRSDSELRLLRKDRHMARRLKEAYNSFARECLARHQTPPQRIYAEDEDFSELRRLIEESKVERIREHRRRAELMFRQARVHEDQFQIMMHNNPLPNLIDRDGTEGIGQYIPSWTSDKSTSLSSGAEPMKEHRSNDNLSPLFETESESADFHSAEDVDFSKPLLGQLKLDRPLSHKRCSLPPSRYTTPALSSVAPYTPDSVFDYALVNRRLEKPKYLTRSYVFLTEKDCCKERGKFADKFNAEFGAARDPIEMLLAKDEIHRRSDQRQLLTSSAMEAPISLASSKMTQLTRSAPTTEQETRQARGRRVAESWQPLNLGALMEYSDKLEVAAPLPKYPENMKFRHGRTPVWHLAQAQSAVGSV